MKIRIILLIFILILSDRAYPQNKNFGSIYTLEKSPELSNKDKILLILDELTS